jgi:hypothetical protein
MKPARRAAFLPLLLVAGIATAATPEQEMEAEAKKLLPMLFSQCGEEYFSKRTFKYRSGIAWIIGQYKMVTPVVKRQQSLTRKAKAEGVEWQGAIQFEASSAREYPHGMQFPERGPNALNRNDTWSHWKPPNLAAYTFLIEKKNGVISMKRRTPQELTAISCSEVPK